jgi:hypothetical protein
MSISMYTHRFAYAHIFMDMFMFMFVFSEVGNVTSKHNDAIRYCSYRFLIAISIRSDNGSNSRNKSDNAFYMAKAITVKSDNDPAVPTAINLRSDKISSQQ